MKIRVTTHSGEEDVIDVDSYDAEKITSLRNDVGIESILIGNYSYSRIDIKNIKPLEEELKESPNEDDVDDITEEPLEEIEVGSDDGSETQPEEIS